MIRAKDLRSATWKDTRILAFADGHHNSRRLYSALSEWWPQLAVSWSINISEALKLCEDETPGLLLYAQAKDKASEMDRIFKLAFAGAHSRSSPMLVVAVIDAAVEDAGNDTVAMDDLCHPDKGADILEKLWKRFQMMYEDAPFSWL